MTARFASIYHDYLAALIAGDRRECGSIVTDLLKENVGIRDIYIHLFQKSLYEVGEMWARNTISVAVEHMATAITESLFTLVYPYLFEMEHNGKKAVVSCVANEYHQIGGKMVADVLEMNGWNTFFLGANIPERDLLELIDTQQPDIVCLSLSIYFNLPSLQRIIETIHKQHASLPLIVGGQAFRFGGRQALEAYANVTLIDSIPELERHVRSTYGA